MNFNSEKTGVLEIRTKEQAQDIVKRSIDAFIRLEKDDGVWGRLVLLFKEHQEVYDIDDSYDELEEDENGPFDELCDEIIKEDLIGSIYVHYLDEDHDSIVICGISSRFLDSYIGGFKSENEEVEFTDDGPDMGVRGEPWAITRYIDLYKGSQYYKLLVKKFNILIGEKDEYAHFAMPMKVEGWGDCHLFRLDAETINRLFNKRVKNDFLFYILNTGIIVILTPLSLKYTISDNNFVASCSVNGRDDGNTNISQMGLYYQNGTRLMACYYDGSVIDAVKMLKGITKETESTISSLTRMNMGTIIEDIEDYCNTVCSEFDR